MPRAESLQPRFGEVLRDARLAHGLTQERLAELTALHWTYLSGLERGLHSPSLDVVLALARALGMRAHELVRAAEERQAPD